MFLVQEICKKGFQVICTKPYIYCKVFEDNSCALELARLPKLRPCTKHIIFPVGTENQIADALTKALSQNIFQRHRRYMCGL
jgi:hypothetical protein